MAEVLLDIRNLHVWFKVYGGVLKVLNGVNFTVGFGERVGLVGETGCGKTTTMKAVLRILPRPAYVPQGEIFLHGKDVLRMSTKELADLRGRGLSMIFQDPTSALNPVFTIGQQLYEIIHYAAGATGSRIKDRKGVALRALQEARLPDAAAFLHRLCHCHGA
jgi:peptide/nickel transport system ATP-binding protein